MAAACTLREVRRDRKLTLAIALSSLASFANAAIIYVAELGPEAPGATGSGFVHIAYDTVANTFVIQATWSGLSGTTTVAHIHCCTATPGTGTVGVAVTPTTLPGFPVGLQAGTYLSPVIDLDIPTSFTSGFINNFAGGIAANADAALIAGIESGRAYFNIHTNLFPGGEIRGFLQVPEPTTIALLGLGLGGLIFIRRKHA